MSLLLKIFSVCLKPINRKSSRLVAASLNQFYKQGLYINVNDGLGHCSVSLDNFPPQLIQTCDHWKPQRHTSSAILKLKVPSKTVTASITRADFIREYCIRIVENSFQDELLWTNVTNFSRFHPHLSLCFLGLLMETFLIGIENIVAGFNGNIAYRRTEYIANGGHFLLHRIWIQIVVTIYDEIEKKKKDTESKQLFQKKNVVVKKKFISATQRKQQLSSNPSQDIKPLHDVSMLYLTIIDHFQWDT
ncbi:uncharacterized protein LOC128884408 [Hylaeus volcanicus]|uniref:uncharacterized protein LOC128884408 n=1 Tax=Hylaeus volcanicus TaxID=313075 RepID=UPI0023B839D3|nr:uncharacterized protein LOC128884408 [Hylaeus volcanicus]